MFQRVYCKLLCEMKDGNFGWSCRQVKAPLDTTLSETLQIKLCQEQTTALVV